MMNLASLLLVVLFAPARAFAPVLLPQRASTHLALDKSIADMIDQEIYRQHHKEEYQKEWMDKNREAVVQSFESTTASLMLDDATEFRQRKKDEKLASKNPQQYCADRCIATGNCDVYEDFFELSAEKVIEFCNDCVLADDEEPCEIPEAFFDSGKLSP